jgi:hypothetical protein
MVHSGVASQPDQMGNFLLRNDQNITTQMNEDTHVSTNILAEHTDYAAL